MTEENMEGTDVHHIDEDIDTMVSSINHHPSNKIFCESGKEASFVDLLSEKTTRLGEKNETDCASGSQIAIGLGNDENDDKHANVSEPENSNSSNTITSSSENSTSSRKIEPEPDSDTNSVPNEPVSKNNSFPCDPLPPSSQCTSITEQMDQHDKGRSLEKSLELVVCGLVTPRPPTDGDNHRGNIADTNESRDDRGSQKEQSIRSDQCPDQGTIINFQRSGSRRKFQNNLDRVDETNVRSCSLSRGGGQCPRNNSGQGVRVSERDSRHRPELGANAVSVDGCDSWKHTPDPPGVASVTTEFRNGKIHKTNHFKHGRAPMAPTGGNECRNVQYKYNSSNSNTSTNTDINDVSTGSVDRASGFVSVFEKPYTRGELKRALPRKSFFSCHERAMKNAGFQMDDPAAKKRAERLKVKLERIANEFNPLPSKMLLETGKTNVVKDDVQIVVTDASQEKTPIGDADPEGDHDNTLVNSDAADFDAVDGVDRRGARVMVDNLQHLLGRKRGPSSARAEYIECVPLISYLEYVRNNRHEYINHAKTSKALHQHGDEHSSRLVRLGQAFELRHLGGIPRQQEEDVLVMAAKAVRPRTADPSRFCKRDKAGGLTAASMAVLSLKQTRPSSDDKRQQEKNTGGATSTTATKEEEHPSIPKTEIEKRKMKADEWSRTVSTSTLTKARIQSLRELGTDDSELTKWWEAFRQCRYLRQNVLLGSSS